MNKIKNLFVIILFAWVAFSCSDILDRLTNIRKMMCGKVLT